MSHNTSRTQSELTDAERRALRCVVANMIPASAEYGIPGADDDVIFADIVASLDRETGPVRQALAQLDLLCGHPFGEATLEHRCNALDQFRRDNPALTAALIAATVRCYYRDDRVMRSLGMEPRPPFPKGFDVAQGDWSLLNPVRARGRLYRDAP